MYCKKENYGLTILEMDPNIHKTYIKIIPKHTKSPKSIHTSLTLSYFFTLELDSKYIYVGFYVIAE